MIGEDGFFLIVWKRSTRDFESGGVDACRLYMYV